MSSLYFKLYACDIDICIRKKKDKKITMAVELGRAYNYNYY